MSSTIQAAAARAGGDENKVKKLVNFGHPDCHKKVSEILKSVQNLEEIRPEVRELSPVEGTARPLPTQSVSGDNSTPPSVEEQQFWCGNMDMDGVTDGCNINIATVGKPTSRYTDQCNINIAVGTDQADHNIAVGKKRNANVFISDESEVKCADPCVTDTDPCVTVADHYVTENRKNRYSSRSSENITGSAKRCVTDGENSEFTASHEETASDRTFYSYHSRGRGRGRGRGLGRPLNRVLYTVEKEPSLLTSPVRPTKPRNPKMLNLDFLVSCKENMMKVHKVLITKSDIRNFSIRQLERGGISILFKSVNARDFASELLCSLLKNELKPQKHKFGSLKKSFEISCLVPKGIDPEDIHKNIESLKFLQRKGNVCVFFMSTKEAAKNLIENGFIFDSFLLTFKPFVFPARISCRSCGSLEHTQCENITCTKCGGPHLRKDCNDKDKVHCLHCSQDHDSFRCPSYIDKQRLATMHKRKSYADVLKQNQTNVAQTPSPSTGSAKVTPFEKKRQVDQLVINGEAVSLPVITSLLEAFLSMFKITSHNIEDVISTIKEEMKPSAYSKAIRSKEISEKRQQAALYSNLNDMQAIQNKRSHNSEMTIPND